MDTASWNELERTIEQLHDAARRPIGARDFYRQLLADSMTVLDAVGGAAWRGGAVRPELICQFLPDDDVEVDWSARVGHVAKGFGGGETTMAGRLGAHDVLVCPVAHSAKPAGADGQPESAAVLELWMPAGASPAVRQGWLDFVAAVADVAADFHARDELRRLRGADALRGQAVELLRRASAPRTLAGAAAAVANEGRRLLGCDRVCVVARRGSGWRLMACSGADAVPRRTELARDCERLAARLADWGEPLEYSPALNAADELPSPLVDALEQLVDHSHARSMACAPIGFAEGDWSANGFDVALIAENFFCGIPVARAPVVELGELCAPALARAAQLDRFPVRPALRWADRLSRLRNRALLKRPLLAVAGVVGVVAAVTLIRIDFAIEAPARLAARVQREVFATGAGAVAEVRVAHGQMVRRGDVLIVLSDPEISLELQRTQGEIDAARKRLNALAVTRTDRTLRDEVGDDRLPLSAQQRELEERLASLERRRQLLDRRREALTLRSPRSGQVLTRDVQTLLESRPVERGQALLTIADIAKGWELRADVPQRQIGHVLSAQAESHADLPVDFRLAGDVMAEHSGRVVAVRAAAPLETENLRDPAAPVEVRIAVDGAPPAARAGMSAAVRIHCGRRSLAYVWLHDAAATLYRWLTF